MASVIEEKTSPCVTDEHEPVGRSFRDPAGFTFRTKNRFLRAVEPAAFEDLDAFLATSIGRRWVADGRFIETRLLSHDESAGVAGIDLAGHRVVEHEKVVFPSYPEEWPSETPREVNPLVPAVGSVASRSQQP